MQIAEVLPTPSQCKRGSVSLLLRLRFASASIVAALAIALVAPSATHAAEANTLTDAEQKAGWKLLFDGKTTEGWRGYKMDKLPPGWAA
ncbi:MAG: DUF1080 domain-containing protein, partial [Verrucomicrobiales bacterium]|nr:DUF1080 domain-containing protein [Verrucomicrobiales bacterium]